MMSTLRWELMEEYSEIEKRENVELRSFEKERIKIIEEYPPLYSGGTMKTNKKILVNIIGYANEHIHY